MTSTWRSTHLRRSLSLAGIAVAWFAVHPLQAQVPDGSANRAAMDRLELMVGRWHLLPGFPRGVPS